MILISTLTTHAAWVLTVAFVISLVYELYRATWKAGTSRHDTMRAFVMQGIALYGTAGVVITLLFRRAAGSERLALGFAVLMILISIFYYNPKVLLERRPQTVDWVEDLVFTGWLFVAAAQLAYSVSAA